MESENIKNIAKQKPEIDIKQAVLSRVKSSERKFLQNVKYITLGIAFLFLLGYIWRIAYYRPLGIPPTLLDFPFPEILVPRSLGLITFLAWLIIPFSYAKFRDYFVKTKRTVITTQTGITQPMENVLESLSNPNTGPNKNKYRNNMEAIAFYTIDYCKEKIQRNEHLTNEDLEDLVGQLKQQLPDVPDEMKNSMIIWTIQYFIKEKEEISNILGNALKKQPEGSLVFNKVLFFIFISSIISLLYVGPSWFIAFIALGYFMGHVAFKLSYVENRVQFWHILWISIILACGVQFIDGFMYARFDIKNNKFPFVSISALNQEDTSGILLGFFKGKYFINFFDEHDFLRVRVLEAEHVEKMDLSYQSWTLRELQKTKDHSIKLEKEYEELMKRREVLIEESGDPNFLDGIEIPKPIQPIKEK